MPEAPKPVLYEPALHFSQVLAWFQEYDEAVTQDELPQLGYIVPGKAAGFLYRTDSSLCWIESLVASKQLSKEERSEALDAIVMALARDARRLGFKTMMGLTQLEAVVQRALRLGFVYVDGGFRVIALPLDSVS